MNAVLDYEVFNLGGSFTVAVLLIPFFNGIIGYATNWVGIKMMFYPTRFVGWRLPWTMFGIPMIGWQGMVPNRVAKLASIAVDTVLMKVATMKDLIEEMEPEVVAAYVAETQGDEIRRIMDQILSEEYPDLWGALPAAAKLAMYKRVEAELPTVLAAALGQIGDYADRLLSVKLMVVRFLEEQPEVMNRLVNETVPNELAFVVRSGLYLGIPLGIFPMLIYVYTTQHPLAVPIGAAIVGYLTNWIALKMIFYPAEPKTVLGFRMHGLMLRRQKEISLQYARIMAHDLLTAPKIVNQMMNGPGGDRTRRLIADTIKPVIDRNVGLAKHLIKVAAGSRYDEIRETVAVTAVNMAPKFIEENAEFIKDRQEKLAVMIGTRMGSMSYAQFQQLMRAPFETDEWLAISIGAFIGFAAGWIQMFATL